MDALNASSLTPVELLSRSCREIVDEVCERYFLQTGGSHRECTTREDIHAHVMAYAASLFTASFPLWLHHLGWAKSRMMELGCEEADVLRLFDAMRSCICKRDSDPQTIQIFDLGLQALPSLADHVTCSITPYMPFADISQKYLDQMLAFDQQAARSVLQSADLPIEELYIRVIGPAIYRVGELWQSGKITPAQEHGCTAMTTRFIAELRSQHGLPPTRKSRRLIAASIEGDRHDIGIRMVADLFEFRGWVSLYLGADVPIESLVTVATDYEADLLAVSVSMTANLPQVRRLADSLKANRTRAALLVGGQPFLIAPTVYSYLGADATAADPHSAVGVANEVLAAALSRNL